MHLERNIAGAYLAGPDTPLVRRVIDGEMPENGRMKFQLLHIDGCPNTEVVIRAAIAGA